LVFIIILIKSDNSIDTNLINKLEKSESSYYFYINIDKIDISTVNLEWSKFDNVKNYQIYRNSSLFSEEDAINNRVKCIAQISATQNKYRDLLNETGIYYYGLKVNYKTSGYEIIINNEGVNISVIPNLTWDGYEIGRSCEVTFKIGVVESIFIADKNYIDKKIKKRRNYL